MRRIEAHRCSKYKQIIREPRPFFCGISYICKKIIRYGIPHTSHRRRAGYTGVREIQPRTRRLRGVHRLRRRQGSAKGSRGEAAPHPPRHDDARAGRHRDLQGHTQLALAAERHGGVPLGRRQRGVAARRLRRGGRRLHQQTHQDEHLAQSRAGHPETHRAARRYRRHIHRHRALRGAPRQRDFRAPAQGVRAAATALLATRQALHPRGDLFADMGRQGGGGRPHHRRAHTQAAPEDRRRTHRHRKGHGVQIRARARRQNDDKQQTTI